VKITVTILVVVATVALLIGAFWFVDNSIAPFCLNSRIERLGEKNLPTIQIERGRIVYCRMKADDFRFPLPPDARAVNPIVTGIFDTVDGSVEARFEGTNHITALEYENWLSEKVPVGGQVTAEAISGGLLVKFHYFGDR
jgi:hypothetical protein